MQKPDRKGGRYEIGLGACAGFRFHIALPYGRVFAFHSIFTKNGNSASTCPMANAK